ncbi:XTP/dITP diphosphatase [Jeotgalibacillus sp. R-1-5s-1]|uniref:XTP/dITP diphosphatase n=1 Tax=Jeotgalibacillus sp. R-1-5s-1 TaxID=2555897 RepID=UPI00106DAA7F|nr:XTP/dITP diphosphatase [Jeotgalibacillus sp. R-1-5s-1]TFD92447.1 XTP/dITP diphosphatase [Jeotgalibacillus sp. R-1-5s-1]
MNTIIVATNNAGKAAEFEAMFAPLGFQVKTLKDFPELGEVEETGVTFEENAVLKAETIAKKLGIPVIADDSGLLVDALDGEPGVYSARYAGEDKDDEANINKVLSKLEGIPDEKRTAHFHCTLAFASPDVPTRTYTGVCSGRITHEKIGQEGFGYDPIFWRDEEQKTLAQMTKDQKAQISHRGNALKELKKDLQNLLK